MKHIKKILIPSFVFLIIIAVFTGCLSDPPWMKKADTPVPTLTPTPTLVYTEVPTGTPTPVPTPTPEPTPTATPTPEPTPSPTPEPTVPAIAALPTEDMGAAYYDEASDQISYISNHLGSDLPGVNEYCAYITGKSMRMDGQTDIIFDYVEWLSDPEATTAYLEDHPGAAPEDYEFIEQVGYIRNTDPDTVVLHTSDDSRYFLNRPLYTSQIGEVGYDEFRDWLFPLTENAFVIVCEVDGVIARVEWIYMP